MLCIIVAFAHETNAQLIDEDDVKQKFLLP